MKYKTLIIEKKEYVYLKRILNLSGYSEDIEIQKSLHRLNEEIKTAQVLDDEQMPEDIIRFNSKITVESESGWKKTIQIVTPNKRSAAESKISILTPMGAALFGYSEGDEVEWDFPGGKQKLKLKKVEKDLEQRDFEVSI
ncbi:GreA/GreB family elongation factor [Psychroflexus tropicus]|uniref:GreA/GreB family elongation factor n=1 Tax=Psychroflexus tropicus TaxID=197345 RepID=UPI0003804832|nr:GreA/GreB family elongation factor [Psychroflexus tropicus]